MHARAILLASWVVLLLPVAAAAGDASVAGRVVDVTGAPLPGVAVVVAAADGSRLEAATDATGAYRVDGVPAGRARVTFALVGFATVVRPGVAVVADARTGLDVRLQVGLTSDVTVVGRDTFVNLAEIEEPESSLVGFATSASQGAVTGRQVAARPIMRAGEVLETVPGLIASQHSGEGKANQYYLRGFNLDHGTDFATSLAGMPVNFPTHAHGHGYTDVNFLIPELVAGVQYRKGPYGAEDGDFATAGSASIAYLTSIEAPTASLSGGGQGWRRLFAAASPRVGNGSLLAAVETSENDGPWVRPDDYRKVNAVLRYTRGTAQRGWSLTAMGYDASWASTDQVPARAIESGLDPALRPHRRHRRRAHVALQRVGRVAAVGRAPPDPRVGLRPPLRPRSVLELHLLPRRPGPGRSVRAARSAHRRRRPGDHAAARRAVRPAGRLHGRGAPAP